MEIINYRKIDHMIKLKEKELKLVSGGKSEDLPASPNPNSPLIVADGKQPGTVNAIGNVPVNDTFAVHPYVNVGTDGIVNGGGVGFSWKPRNVNMRVLYLPFLAAYFISCAANATSPFIEYQIKHSNQTSCFDIELRSQIDQDGKFIVTFPIGLGLFHISSNGSTIKINETNNPYTKTTLELQGISCIPLEHVAPRKNIMVSRSFGQPIADFHNLREAVANFATRAAEKLRQQNSFASGITVFIRTNPFNKTDKQYSNSITLKFPKETDNTLWILKTASQGLEKIFRESYKYKKAGTMLLDIIPSRTCQRDLFIDDVKMDNSKLMNVLDNINQKYGRQAIQFAICGYQKSWSMSQQKVSPSYTTKWTDILTVKAI